MNNYALLASPEQPVELASAPWTAGPQDEDAAVAKLLQSQGYTLLAKDGRTQIFVRKIAGALDIVTRATLAIGAGETDLPNDAFRLLIASALADTVRHVRNASGLPDQPGQPAHLIGLSPREREVLDLVIQGLSTKQIAHRLAISARTIEVHRQRVMRKMKARNVAELVRLAVG